MPSGTGIATLADVAAFEKTPYEQRVTDPSTYHQIVKSAMNGPDDPAISFIASGNDFANPVKITYAQLLGRINQTANLFHELGVGTEDTVSYLLPNLPQTFFTLWGAEAVGVANPINPLLEPSSIADICRAAGTKILVALGEVPVVYVQLAENAVVGQGELLVHAAGQIAERAAIPKDVIVVDSMPLTAVGKVFKPVLRQDVMAGVCRAELSKASDLKAPWQVEVEEDPKHGAKAVITITRSPEMDEMETRALITELLIRHTFHWEIVFMPVQDVREEAAA
jgi:acyl-CoA synthetase (AMP-forming)/AMP-acid ligase II